MAAKKTTYFYSHNSNSEGVKALCKELGARRVRHENSRFRGKTDRVVINWGATELPKEVAKCNVINTPEAVGICSDKVKFFQAVDGECAIPEFTTSIKEAKKWAEDDNIIVFCRTLTRGHAGRGIVESNTPEEVVQAGLYTKYIPKKEEYRIHMLHGEPFLVQRKALSRDYDKNMANWRVRNHAGGFIFTRNEDHEPNKMVFDEATKAFNQIKGLTFGSVDVIFNEHRGQAYVLEINTASGLSGSTVDDYVNMLKKVI